MKETINSSEKKNQRLSLFKNFQNLESFLKICDDFYSHLSDVLVIENDDEKKSGELRGKLIKLGNKYQQLLDIYRKRYSLDDKKFDVCFGYIQSFFSELNEIFGELVNDVVKGESKIVDKFIEKMFNLNKAFCELSKSIKEKENGVSFVSYGMKNDFAYDAFGDDRGYDILFSGYEDHKEKNKRLGINVYYPLLELVNRELESLLGGVLEERMVLSEEDFRSKSEKLFIMKFLNIKSYKDFCKKYEVLKNKQRKLFESKKELDECFDEEGNLKSDINYVGLHMENLEKFLKTNLRQVTIQRIIKALEKEKESE